MTDEVAMSNLAPGVYTVSESYSGNPEGIVFDAQFTGACTDNGATGTVTIDAGDNDVCTITNVVSLAVVPDPEE